MSKIPNELKYTKDHEWVREDVGRYFVQIFDALCGLYHGEAYDLVIGVLEVILAKIQTRSGRAVTAVSHRKGAIQR